MDDYLGRLLVHFRLSPHAVKTLNKHGKKNNKITYKNEDFEMRR